MLGGDVCDVKDEAWVGENDFNSHTHTHTRYQSLATKKLHMATNSD